MNCKPIRNNDQMQCHCGLAWDIGEEKPECLHNRRKGDRKSESVKCRYCDGSGFFYSEPDLGPCVCKEPN